MIEDKIKIDILIISKDGISKSDLAAKLSQRSLRRHIAELVDRRYLRRDLEREWLMTTEKGLLFLQKKTM
jgi:predicted transcriptional regulator